MEQVYFKDLGQMDYKTAWDYQEELLRANVEAKSQAARLESASNDWKEAGGKDKLFSPNDSELLSPRSPSTTHHLLFTEHPPVYTLGKSGKIENVLISEEERLIRGIEFFYTNRGGDITFHGPQQIVGYPIIDLEKFYTDIGRYLRNLEEVIILTMAGYGLKGERSAGETGVWLEPGVKGKERKICAIGVRCS
ncbi:MAG: lipoyl(octanoyl) transferase LipB, partial [Bacteroidota bacterium]